MIASALRPGLGLAPLVACLAATTEQLLDLPVRKRLYDHVVGYPGRHLSGIARDLDLETNHAKYHLRKLESEGLVSSKREDGYWRFFPTQASEIGRREVLGPQEKELLSLLRRPVPFRVAVTLLHRGEERPSRLAETADVAPATMSYHLSRMQEMGIVERREDGRAVYYGLHDPEHIAKVLDRFEPPDELVSGFLDAWASLSL